MLVGPVSDGVERGRGSEAVGRVREVCHANRAGSFL